MARFFTSRKHSTILALVAAALPGVGLADVINAATFGAIANDAKPDTRAINRALKKARNGDTVLLEQGEYLTKGEIKGKSGVTL